MRAVGSTLVSADDGRPPARRIISQLLRALGVVTFATTALGAQAPDASSGVVAGTVVTQSGGVPVPSVTVLVDGTERGAVTDAGGRFRITGLSGASVNVTARRIGYRAETVAARVGDEHLRIALSERAVELNSVVVTGTAGATQRREIGNAVSQIQASDIVPTAPVQNVQ